MEDICEITIDHFSGTEIQRNDMHIILYRTTEPDEPSTRPLFQSLKRLQGFHTVRVELHSSLPIFEKMDPQLASDDINKVMRAVEAHLKLALGPAAPGYFSSPGEFDYYGYLEFHPHKHLAKTLKSEGKLEQRESRRDGAGSSLEAETTLARRLASQRKGAHGCN